MLSTTGTDPARCLVHASTNLASAMVLRVPPGTFKLQHCKNRRRVSEGNGPKRMTLGIPWILFYPPEIRLHIRPWKVALGRWGNTFRMGWWDMLVHPMSLEISQVRSATTKAGFTYLKLQSFLPKALESSHPLKKKWLFFVLVFSLLQWLKSPRFNWSFFGGAQFNLTQEICDSDKWQCFSCNCWWSCWCACGIIQTSLGSVSRQPTESNESHIIPMLHVCSARVWDRCAGLEKIQPTTGQTKKASSCSMLTVHPFFVSIYLCHMINQTRSSFFVDGRLSSPALLRIPGKALMSADGLWFDQAADLHVWYSSAGGMVINNLLIRP